MIVIDPGHPSRRGDTGAVVDGVREVDLNYQIAVRTVAVLDAAGLDADLTRGADDVLSLTRRAVFARRRGAALVVSIHCNASEHQAFRGLMAFYKHRDLEGKAIAAAIHKAAPPPLNTRKNPQPATRNQWPRVRNVLAPYECQAVLVECGFLTNASDRAALQDPTVQAGLAFAIGASVAQAAQIITGGV